MSMERSAGLYRMPAEWEPHKATWIAWPYNKEDWPGKFQPIPWVYAEIVRVLSESEHVNILCCNDRVRSQAELFLERNGARGDRYSLHLVPYDRSWLRDSGPTGVLDEQGKPIWLKWWFNAWAKYDNYELDACVPDAISNDSGLPLVEVVNRASGKPVVLEGGGLETNGQGVLTVTEEWLLSDTQVRNPGFTRDDYEKLFAEYLGIHTVIWLPAGCEGDDTHGHVDDVVRFVNNRTVVVSCTDDDSREVDYANSRKNLRHLLEVSQELKWLNVIQLPMPRRIVFDGQVVPASYANFYIGNKVVLVPTFNDPNDRVALNILDGMFPDREVVGINCSDLIWGLGTLHCLTQQQPC